MNAVMTTPAARRDPKPRYAAAKFEGHGRRTTTTKPDLAGDYGDLDRWRKAPSDRNRKFRGRFNYLEDKRAYHTV